MTATNMTQNAQVDQDRFKRCERLQKMGRTAMITRWNTPYAAWIVLLFFDVNPSARLLAHPETRAVKQNVVRNIGRITMIVGLVVATLRPSVAQDPTAGGNLLPNGSFEETTSGGVGDWKSRAWSGQENGRWSVESPGRSGQQCLAIRSEKGSDAAWTATVNALPNTFYRLSGWIKTKDLHGATGRC